MGPSSFKRPNFPAARAKRRVRARACYAQQVIDTGGRIPLMKTRLRGAEPGALKTEFNWNTEDNSSGL
eukprot:scaffold36658_cov68-Phaeocystis_antarctica.AAC.5